MVGENKHLIQKLEHKNENVSTNYKNLKAEVNKVKNGNRKIIKNRPKSVQTHVTAANLKSDCGEDLNQNIQPATTSHLCSSLSTSRAPPLTSDRVDPSPTSAVTTPAAHLSTTPPCTPRSTSGCSCSSGNLSSFSPVYYSTSQATTS